MQSEAKYSKTNNQEYMEEMKNVTLDKNDYIITEKGMSKIVEVIDDDDEDNIKYKLDFAGKKETVGYKNLVFSLSKNIRVIVSTYENRIFDISYPVNINSNFEGFFAGFCEDYNLMENQVCIVYKGSKVSKKEKDKIKFNKDFDFEKDFILCIIGPSEENFFQINKTLKRFNIKEWTTYKYLLKVSKPIFITGIYLFTPWYEENFVTIREFTFNQINNIPDDFSKSESKPKEKKKKSEKTNGLPAETFDDFFNKPENFENEVLQNFESTEIYREQEDYREESDSERDDNFFDKKALNSKMHRVDLEKPLVVPEKYYYISMKVGSNQSVWMCSNKITNRTFTAKHEASDLTLTIYLSNGLKDTLLIGGLSFISKSCFN